VIFGYNFAIVILRNIMRSIWFFWCFALCFPLSLASAQRHIPSPIFGQTTEFRMHTGPLRPQLQAMAKRWGWNHMVWNVQNDYQWYGEVVLRNRYIVPIMAEVLRRYPIQAVFYGGNHVLVMVPREVSA
jgi:hypothetical protein